MKIFCIGAGKTGTTSLFAFLEGLGIRMGSQAAGEALLEPWKDRNFKPIIELAHTAEGFQDFPFSAPFTFQALDAAFPDAKFILTIRDVESWYRSLTRFHTKLLGTRGLPTTADLRAFPYVYRGWILDVLIAAYGVSEAEPYAKPPLVAAFAAHNAAVTEYFRHRPGALLTVDLAEPDAAERIATFIGVPHEGKPLPHLNRT
jgi:hypothetical protein